MPALAPYQLSSPHARGFASPFGVGPVRLSAGEGISAGFVSVFGFGPVRFGVATEEETEHAGTGDESTIRMKYALWQKKRREQREEEELIAMLLLMDGD